MRAALTFLFLVTVEGWNCFSSDDCSYGDLCNFDGDSSGWCESCPGQGSTDRIVWNRSVPDAIILFAPVNKITTFFLWSDFIWEF